MPNTKTSSSTRKHAPLKYTPAAPLRRLSGIKHQWALNALYYASEKDPQIETDLRKVERAFRRFARKWAAREFTASPDVLAHALTEYEKLLGMPETDKAIRYFSLRQAINANDHKAEKHIALLTRRLRKATEQVLFFELTLGQLPRATQAKFTRAPELHRFRYYLEKVFQAAAYQRSEPEEKLVRLKAPQAQSMWHDMVEKLLSTTTISQQHTETSLVSVLERLHTESFSQKPHTWRIITRTLEDLGRVAEHELNAIITDAYTESQWRGYEKPYSSTALAHEVTEHSIESLVRTVTTEGFPISKRFYRVKAAYHDVATLDYSQRAHSIGDELTIRWKDAVAICRDVFYRVHKEYGAIFDRMLENGQIDVFPRPGKRGGAFMSESRGHPTHVMLNHTDTLRGLRTLAHEMGHAIHAERSASQPALYDGFSIATAETASTLFEHLVFQAVYEAAPETRKAALLHEKISDDIATIQRQIAFFNAELELHQTIAQAGAMSNRELAACMRRHLRAYLGPAVAPTLADGYSYVYISHLRYGFYVYTYAFGSMVSRVMAERFTQDKNYVDAIDTFLRAGASDSVANIFRAIELDVEDPELYRTALRAQRADVRALARALQNSSGRAPSLK